MIPVSVNEIFSFSRNHLKIGAGTVVILKRFNNVEKNTGLLAHLRIGYRYQEPDGKFYWEASLIPFLEGDTRAFELDALGSMTAHLWIGVTFGYAFRFGR